MLEPKLKNYISFDDLTTTTSEASLLAEYERVYGEGLKHTCTFEDFKLRREMANDE